MPEALLETHAEVGDVRPLPPYVSLVDTGCFNGGVHGACVDVFVMAATDGVGREPLVLRLAEHYSRHGWPLERSQTIDGKSFAYVGCRPVRGIITWASRCLEIYADPYYEPYHGQPEAPGTVNVYIV